MLFLDDYLISWDFSDKDFPMVNVTRLHLESGMNNLTIDVLTSQHEVAGVVSLRQVMEEWFRHHPNTNDEKEIMSF